MQWSSRHHDKYYILFAFMCSKERITTGVRMSWIETYVFVYFLGLSEQSLRESIRNDLQTSYCINIWLPQYSETNVMHFFISLLAIKGFYTFRALLAHPQEVPHKRRLVYYVFVMAERTPFNSNTGAANWHNMHAIYHLAFMQRLLRISK
jgi:hypothetical protein